VNPSASEVNSSVRPRFGAYIHPVLIATDRRLVLARPVDELLRRPSSSDFDFAWEIPYTDITTFSSTGVGGDSANQIVTVHSRGRELSYIFGATDTGTLVAILKRRVPEAFTESPTKTPVVRRRTTPRQSARPLGSAVSRPRTPKWMWLCILPIGLGAWVPLLAGIRARRPAWQRVGGSCCAASLAGWALLPFTNGHGDTVSTVSGLLLDSGWLMGCLTTWAIAGKYAAETRRQVSEPATAAS
jgi:hypothetical protein